MRSFIKLLLSVQSLFVKKHLVRIPLERNDTCLCGSGRKYKRCCAGKLAKRKSHACKVINTQTGEETFKVYKIKKIGGYTIQTKLNGVNVGIGSDYVL
ncbi:MAG: SEC-C metal-binding domain-containing protein [Bacteroidales bacterium]|jgi:hypothetical protein|nr:SEC-C metal-binding domain-containing protein [Bacteroidales bacterium]